MDTGIITMGSLFDGIGGFPLAASLYGIKTLWASEIVPAAISVTRRHFPDMEHLGDITKLHGGKLTPVHIVSFGSPCQSFSLAAGKRTGLAGKSGLFWEAIRIIREMRIATDEQYPLYCVFENVVGILSANRGRDYQTVLEAFTETEIPMPPSGKWTHTGMVRGGRIDFAWVTWDAQYFGLAQRRRRLYALCDFTGQRAAEILFKPKSLHRYFAEGGAARKGTAADTQGGADGAKRTGQDHVAAFLGGQSATSGTVAYSEVLSPTLKSAPGGNMVPCLCEPQLARTLTARADSSPCVDRGQNVVVQAVHPDIAGTLCASGAGMSRPAGMASETDLCVVTAAKNPDDGNDNPVYCLQGNMISRKDSNGPQGSGINKNIAFTLNKTDKHAVFSCQRSDEYLPNSVVSTQSRRQYKSATDLVVDVAAVDCRNLNESGEISGTLQSKSTGGYSLSYQNPVRNSFVVRRLTPLECERLMGFEDYWTEYGHEVVCDSSSERFCERPANGKGKRLSDSARYQALGNSIAIPCAAYLFSGIVDEFNSKAGGDTI